MHVSEQITIYHSLIADGGRGQLSYCWHIFQKALVTSNKMEPKKKHYFLAQFLIAFLVVWFFLFRLLAFGTIK